MSAQPEWYATQPAWYDESTAPRLGRDGAEEGDGGDGYDDAYLDEDDDELD